MAELSDAKRRIIEALKMVDSSTVATLADEFQTTTTAVRQHLESLEEAGLVSRFEQPSSGRGRPALHWRLTGATRELFADRHGDLTVELISSLRDVLGDEALVKVIDHRAERQIDNYRQRVGDGSLRSKVSALADLRSAEGYLAEVVADNGDLLLIEHHCPISGAAAACNNLCQSELDVFRSVLGPDVSVQREQHLLSAGSRCSYRIVDRTS